MFVTKIGLICTSKSFWKKKKLKNFGGLCPPLGTPLQLIHGTKVESYYGKI